MKETTKPNTSHLVKRDLAVNIAVLPLPTPPAGARGEGWGSAASKIETRNSKSETSSKTVVQETSNFELMEIRNLSNEVDLQFPRFMDIAVRRDEPLSLSQEILTLTTNYRLPNV
jgi:hypothetical protein